MNTSSGEAVRVGSLVVPRSPPIAIPATSRKVNRQRKEELDELVEELAEFREWQRRFRLGRPVK